MDIGTIALILGVILAVGSGLLGASSKFSKRKRSIVSFMLGAAAAALVLTSFAYLIPKFDKALEISQIIYFQGKHGKTLFVFNGSKYANRLTVLNAETGVTLNGEVLTAYDRYYGQDKTEFIGITADKIWLSDYDQGLHARDPYTGERVQTVDLIVTKYPQLDATKKARSALPVEVKTDDGYVFRALPPDFDLEMNTYPPSPFMKLDTTIFKFAVDRDEGGCVALGGKRGMCLYQDYHADKDQTVMVLMTARNSHGSYDVDKRLNNKLKLRNAFFLENSGLNNPKSLLIGHLEINSEYNAQFELSRIDMMGDIVWTIVPGTDVKPNQISVHNAMIYLTIEGRILAFDAKKGTKLWETQL